VVKGKFSYLAPEQLTGAPLDGRTDVFQLGIVLWEMVTMRRLFDGKSDSERVNAVLNRVVRRPSELNPSVPSCLDRTIMRALDRDPARRHQSAHDLETELLDAIAAIGASGGDHSVAKWMQTAFAERHSWRLELERRAIAEAEAVRESEDDDLEIRIESNGADSPWSGLRIQTGPTVADRGSVKSGSSLRGVAVESDIAPPPRSRARYVLPALVVVAAAIWWLRTNSDVSDTRGNNAVAAMSPAPAQAADYEVDIRVVPANASIAIDGVVTASGRYRASFASDGAVHTVTLTAPDHTTVQRRFHGATMFEVNLEPLAPTPEPPATADTNPPATSEPSVDTSRNTLDARQRHRDRAHASAIAPGRGPAPAASPAAGSATNPTATGSAAAPAPARPKPADDSFAPSSDNIDPFKTGN
jgi:serine/threonine protein kinase